MNFLWAWKGMTEIFNLWILFFSNVHFPPLECVSFIYFKFTFIKKMELIFQSGGMFKGGWICSLFLTFPVSRSRNWFENSKERSCIQTFFTPTMNNWTLVNVKKHVLWHIYFSWFLKTIKIRKFSKFFASKVLFINHLS